MVNYINNKRLLFSSFALSGLFFMLSCFSKHTQETQDSQTKEKKPVEADIDSLKLPDTNKYEVFEIDHKSDQQRALDSIKKQKLKKK